MKQKEDAYTLDDLLNKIKTYIKNEDEVKTVEDAYYFAKNAHNGQLRLTGDEYILHPLNVAMILTEIYADYETITTALLHDVINFADVTKEEVEEKFGRNIANLLDDISKINKLSLSADSDALSSYYKKILVGLSGDVRIIILKIADRLHNMRTLWVLPLKKQKEKAKETLEILVPIAHGLGINHIKSELEDLSLKYYKPDVYNDILEKLSESRSDLDNSVNEMMESVSKILNENNIPHDMKGRTKSVYSIYNKLSKGKTFDQIYDILALRFYVNTEAECYLALGLIHAKYKPVPRRFKDYIARPKPNGYQSLHTTVFGVDGKLFEIQIRTYDMDKVAEFGLASHWSYKQHSQKDSSIEQKLQSFRTIIELNEQHVSDEEMLDTVKNEVFNSDNIYVYTPKGDVFEMPNGSTPIDFAYRIHTSVGNNMVGAIVNNLIAPLNYKLNDGDIVKINTSKNSNGPSKEWLNIAYTQSAKNKIKAFFSKIDKAQTIKDGKETFNKEVRKKKLSISEILNPKNLETILSELKINSEDDLYYEIGVGKYSPVSIINIVNKKEEEKEDLNKVFKYNSKELEAKGDIIIGDVKNIKVTYGRCCMPVKGDEIKGYISKGMGITIHRKNCHNIVDLKERVIDAKWNMDSNKKYITNLLIYTNKDHDILLDLISKTTHLDISIKSINSLLVNDYNVFDVDLLVNSVDDLNKYISMVKSISYVNAVERGFK